MANRIMAAIQKKREQIQQRMATGALTQVTLDKLNKELDLTIMDHAAFQQHKSHSFSAGVLTLEEAETVYELLGPSPDFFNRQLVEVKVVLTQLFAELIQRG